MKTTSIYFKYLFVCVLMCAFVACGDDDDNNKGSNANIEVLFPEDLAITCTGANNDAVTVTFVAENDWTAIVSHNWIDLSKRTGSAGDQKIIVTVEDNDDFKTRIGTITIKDKISGKSVDIVVTQGEKGSNLTFSTEDQNGTILAIDNEKQEITAEVSVKSNYDYSIAISPDWLTYEDKGRNSDGSRKYIFHADPVKLYTAGGYGEQTAIVSFAYQAETRTPATKEYAVKFAGITPAITFYEDEESIAATTLSSDEGTYRSVVKVTSNVAWKLNNSSDYSEATIISENISKNFFETQLSMNVEIKDGALDTDDLTGGKVEVLDANTDKVLKSLPVIVEGVGTDYIYIDETNFIEAGKDQTTGVYMFAKEGGKMNFKVQAANLEDVSLLLLRVVLSENNVPSVIRRVRVDTNGYDPEDYMMISSPWGQCKPVIKSRSAIQSGEFTIEMNARDIETETGMNGEMLAYENRFFALFAVSTKKYADPDEGDIMGADLFDINEESGAWELRPELENSYIILGQNKEEMDVTKLESDLKDQKLQLPLDKTEFYYNGLDLATEFGVGATWYWEAGEPKYAVGDVCPDDDNIIYGLGDFFSKAKIAPDNEYDPTMGTIKFTEYSKSEKPNRTKTTYYLVAGNLGNKIILRFTAEDKK